MCWCQLPREDPEHSLEILLTEYMGLSWKGQYGGQSPEQCPLRWHAQRAEVAMS